jgi:hypothetical protein
MYLRTVTGRDTKKKGQDGTDQKKADDKDLSKEIQCPDGGS